MMAKGTYAGINLATADLDRTFELGRRRRGRPGADRPAVGRSRLRAFRDPAGNMIRIFEVR